MKANRDVLEDEVQEYEQQVRGLKSYIKELTDQVARHGTEKAEYETDLMEAENNVSFYEAEITRIKGELGGARGGSGRHYAGTILPRTARQGVGSFVFMAIGFVAGAALGSTLMPKGKDRQQRGGVR